MVNIQQVNTQSMCKTCVKHLVSIFRIPEEVTNILLNIQSSVAGLPDLVSAQYVHLLCCLIDKTNQTTKSKILDTVKQFCSDAHRKEQKMPKV